MTTDPKRVKDIFLAAAELPDESAQVAYLEQACGGDAGLRERVEALLRSHDPAGSFLGTPAAALADSDVAAQQTIDSACPGGPGHEKEAEDLGFLWPPTRPASLGRIGHYEVLQVLGKGGFGIVFRAFDDILQRVVAIKVMAPQLAATSPARKRFLQEARTSAQVRHENVVQVYEVGEQPLPYLAMEFIPGETLQQRLDRTGPLDVPETLRIGRQIAEGLAAAHATDLIHRDIKPGNVLLEGAQRKVKITDFGLARAADDASLTQSGTIAGTPMYMAPEQALGGKLDQRADLFSFGSVLYQMVSGRPPFRAPSTLAVLKRVAEDAPRPIREIIPETPAWLCEIISKLHAKNPDERYQSAREVADVLADCEAQLKAHSGLRDFKLIPRAKAQPVGRWKWIAVAALVLPLLAFGLYALTRPPTNGAGKGTSEPAKADPIQPVNAPAPESAWVQLFNGQDLTGWKNDDNHWTVENGMLVTRLPKGAAKTSGFLQTIRKDYRDFHIRAEAKINAGGDSGVFFRFGEQGDVSLQAQITTAPGGAGSLLRHAATIAPGSQQVLPETWFTLEVIAQGPRVMVIVDGQEAVTWFDPTGGTQAGPIGFESGFPGTEFFVRKVEIKSPEFRPIDFNGTWASDWCDITFTQDLSSREASPLLGGTYNQGHIAGTINLQSRVFTGTFREKNGSAGRLRLTLSPNGTSISGRYYHADLTQPGSWRPERAASSMYWNMTRQEAVPNADPQTLAKEEWVQLFNGKNLTGWKTHPDQPGQWEVKDGILLGSTRRSLLFSERGDYENFHLRAEARINLGGDSGIFFRTGYGFPSEKDAGGYEAELVKNLAYVRKTGTVSVPRAEGPPLAIGLNTDDSLTQPDEWFTLEIIAQKNHFITKVNGHETANCSDPLNNHAAGHIALQVWNPNTVVQFRKIEIQELPPYGSNRNELAKRRFASDEWIDVIPLIDPQLDKWDVPQRTGKNGWRIEQGELAVGGDALASKLVLPLDSDWPAFECELEFTRRAGDSGFNLNIPGKQGECPLLFDPTGTSGTFLGSRAKGVQLKTGAQLTTGQRTTMRVEVRRQQEADQVSVALNGATIGEWTGDRSAISYSYKEGFPHDRRVSLWIHPGGNEFVFHRIRVRMLDGGTAETLRPIPSTPPVPAAKQDLPPTFKNSIGMEFVIVPKGKSWLGGGQEKLGDKEVEISADFYLGKYEVTQGEWEQVMGENPSYFSRDGDGLVAVKEFTDAELKRLPVENVTWDQCQVFVNKLNKLEKQRQSGWVYRLPKEVEWEYACRGGPISNQADSAFDYYFARPTNTLLPKQANFKPNGLDRTCKVGLFEPNVLGLYDMHGNVDEWCDDQAFLIDLPLGPAIRGGSYDDPTAVSLNVVRHGGQPTQAASNVGLRLARVPFGAASPEAKTPPVTAAKPEPLPPTYQNSLGMEFVVVPKGKSWLGGGQDKLGEEEVEIPADFYLGKYEVTQEEWEKVMDENPSRFSRNRVGKDAVKDIPDADLKTLTIHHGRHTFISHALAGGRTLAEVRDAAGHANVSITSAYLHVAVEDEGVGTLFGPR